MQTPIQMHVQSRCCRLATKARKDHSLDWLHQASGLALTQAGQRVLLQAGLPQELLHQLQQLPMQMLDDDSEASREQKRSQTLHNCQARQQTSTQKLFIARCCMARYRDYLARCRDYYEEAFT